MIKQAVILAAGKGRRMKKGSADENILTTPKPLLKVNGMPIIERKIKDLKHYGVDVAVVINPSDEAIFREKLESYDIDFLYQEEALGTGHALNCAKDFATDELFLVLMGDDISIFDMESVLMMDRPSVFGYEVDNVENYGVILVDSRGAAKGIAEKRMRGRGFANTGMYVLSRKFFDIFPKIPRNEANNEYYLTDAIEILYECGDGLVARNVDYWKGINMPEDLRSANDSLMSGINIRKAGTSDFSEILRVLHQLSPIQNVDEEINGASQKHTMEMMLSDPNYYVAVAEFNGQIISTATLLVQYNLTHNGRPYAHIENVVTDNRYRGKSVGKTLIKYLTGIASDRNCYKVILDCSPENVSFYEKCGFSRNGEVEMRLSL